ncbi:hypothetical protein Tsubulata_028075, partial [Turnera subulata]
VYGLEKAEEFFNGIPNHLRNFQVNGALLWDLGFVQTLGYSLILNLCSKMGKHEKLDMLMQEMEESGITFDMYICNTRLNDYAATSNIEGLEKLLSKMEADPHITDVEEIRTTNQGRVKGFWEKAEAYVNKIVGNGVEVDARSWVLLGDGYHL